MPENQTKKPYFITQRKIIIAQYVDDSQIVDLVISYMINCLLVRHKGVRYSRSIKLDNLDSNIFYQIQNEINGMLGFSLVAKSDRNYKWHEIKALGSYLSLDIQSDRIFDKSNSANESRSSLDQNDNFMIYQDGNEMSYSEFCLSDPIDFADTSKENEFIITKINGNLYDVVTGLDILLVILKASYGLDYSRISKKRRDKLKLAGVKSINL